MVLRLIRVILYASGRQVLPTHIDDQLVYVVPESSYLELYVTTHRAVSCRVTILNAEELGLPQGRWSMLVQPGGTD